MACSSWRTSSLDCGSCSNLDFYEQHHCSRYICFYRWQGTGLLFSQVLFSIRMLMDNYCLTVNTFGVICKFLFRKALSIDCFWFIVSILVHMLQITKNQPKHGSVVCICVCWISCNINSWVCHSVIICWSCGFCSSELLAIMNPFVFWI